MIIGPPPKFHGTRDILWQSSGFPLVPEREQGVGPAVPAWPYPATE